MARVVGLILTIIGVVLQPIGWTYSLWICGASGLMILVGVLLVLVARQGRDDDEFVAAPSPTSQISSLGDTENLSGQRTAGRSVAWEASHAEHGTDALD